MSNSPSSEFKQKAAKSGFWSVIEKAGIQGFSVVVGIIMTRLLLPSDYGLVAMLDIFMGLGVIISNFGFGQAYVRDTDSVPEEQSALFMFSFSVGMGLYLLLFLLAGVIADFYAQPLLSSVTRVFAINIPLQAVSQFHQYRLSKELRLQTLAKIKLFNLVFAGITGITLSVKAFGVWAIVFYITSYNVLNVILLSFFSGWRFVPGGVAAFVRKRFRYSSKIFGADLLDVFYTNFFTALIGKVYRTDITGYYSKARLIQNIPIISSVQIIQAVSFPLLAGIRHAPTEVLDIFRKQVRFLSYVLSFILGIMIITARPFVAVLLTEKWLPMVPYYQLLCVLAWFLPMQSLHTTLLNALGRSDLSLRIEILKKTVAVLAILLVFRLSVEMIILSQIAIAVVGLAFHMKYTNALIGYSFRRRVIDHSGSFLLMCVSGGLTYYLLPVLESNAVMFFVQLFFTAGLFIAAAFAFGISEHPAVIKIVKSGFRKS